MAKKYIKFISANVCTMVLLLFVLLSHYTIVGLISYLVGSGLLFLGTLLDKNKAEFGVANKFAFYTFISVLILFGIWAPFMLEAKSVYSFASDLSIWGIVISLVLAIVFMATSTGNKHYVLKRCLKYSGQAALFFFICFILTMPRILFPLIVVNVLVFMLADIYSSKNLIFKSSGIIMKADKAYWMAFGINFGIVAAYIFAPSFFVELFMSDNISKILDTLLSGFNVPLFIILMLGLSGLFMYADNILNTKEAADSYLTISLAGLCLALTVYNSIKSPQTLIVLLLSVIVYLVFGYSIISKDKGNDSNPVYLVLNLGAFAPMIVSLSITAITVFSIIFVYLGYLLPWITLICGVILVLVSRKIFNGFWIANTMRWQMILLAIALFASSIAFVNNRVGNSLGFVIANFAISSVAVWALGIRDGVWDNKFTFAKVIDCVLLGIISLAVVL